MTMLDKVIAAVTPPESEAARAEARAKAREKAVPGGWLEAVLDHHLQIEDSFAAVRNASDATSRRGAQKQLAVLLTGHSLAEEAVIYPALALNGEKAHATSAYTEQSAAKVQLAGLDELDPMSQDYLDKLEHLRGAVLHHVYEEEKNWFCDLQDKLDKGAHDKLAARYAEEFRRYIGMAPPQRGAQGMAQGMSPGYAQGIAP
ncbi:MAG TPA: hemerythrin domain-containing protein [Methylibium sp.]|uniref:hemerythrin domain-containing protein n=1 Tax=Methylibium sp. TaxID=2067992 RepID=UPI002DBAFC14|nr:hemerythrin domain-containing protein [Methylibium sp.]HEU4459771.1 hemerythrin domain-containing protein [Methylibium sp.]